MEHGIRGEDLGIHGWATGMMGLQKVINHLVIEGKVRVHGINGRNGV